MFSEDHVTDLLPAYALDCLDEAELEQVMEHLVACSTCRAELQHFQGIADQLPLAAPVVEPPASVKVKLMERAEAQQRAVESQKARSARRERLGKFFRQVAPVWSLASLLLIIGLAASNLLLWRQVNRLQSIPQPALHVVNLSNTEAAPDATGMIVLSLDGEHGTLVVDRLPDLGEEQQYQLWLVRDEQRTSGGVFSVTSDGYGWLWVRAPDPLASYSRFGITIEPKGGSPGPTGEGVLAGNL